MAWSTTINSSQTTNPGGNSSTVYASLTFSAINQGYSGYSTSFNVVIDGVVVGSGGGPSALNTDGIGTDTWTSPTYSRTFPHDANGYRGAVGTSGTFYGSGGFSPPSGGVGGTGATYPAIDYVLLPSAPSSVTASAVGSVITVTSGEASTPGPTITAYKVSYASSTNGGASWSAWSTEVNMTNRVYTYSSLTPGLTYKFQVRATNGDGDGPYTESNTVFLTAGGKRYTGSNWALTAAAAKRFNGSAFVSLTTAKRYTDAGTWVSLS